MELSGKAFHLAGKVQHYAWGGYNYIPELIGFTNNEHKPCAEYWMGAHPSASSVITDGKNSVSLNEYIKSYPSHTITNPVFTRFGELPYLFKILDVKDMLSIQVHPTKAEAEKGFDAEEAAGIPINAPHRNYKDRNHKPEVMVALSEFWLLHGFKLANELVKTLQDIKEFNVLIALFKLNGYKGLYQFVMEMGVEEVNAFLIQTVKREIRNKKEGLLTKSNPGWWVAKLFEGVDQISNIDKGVFSIYFFNIVNAKPGEAVFQGAGLPHAYLEGQNIELMANSDNVLRGGLTPKHIDVTELIKHTLFEGIIPNVMQGNEIAIGEKNYPCPVPDFSINKIDLNNNLPYSNVSGSLEILLVTDGGVVLNNNMTLKKGEAVCLLPGASYTLISSGQCTLFKAFV